MTESERADREEFTIEACHLMRDRFDGAEVYERMGLPVEELTAHFRNSDQMAVFRRFLFMKIVPNIRKLGLLTDRVKSEFERMGVLEFATLSSTDEDIVPAQAES